MFESLTKALTTVKETVKDIRDETQAAAEATTALDKGMVRVINTAEEEVGNIKAAAAKFMDGLKALGGQGEEKAVAVATGPSARETAAQIKEDRVGMFAANAAGPASGRGPTDWRDRFGKAGYQQEAETAPTASPAP